MRIAYLVNQYPMVSHSFIRREILALERRGVEVVRIAVRGWDAEIVDEEDHLERKRTRYVLRDGASALMLAAMRTLLTQPGRFIRALALAWRMSRRGENPLPLHLIYLAEACRIEPWLRDADVQHLHAHFGTNPAEVAMLVHTLGGPQWSFTVHGPEEFDKPEFIGLRQKVLDSAFVVSISSYGRSQLYRWVDHPHWPKVKVVHCGLEPGFCNASICAPSAAPRLVCIGRLCEQKGQLLLVEATRRLVANGTDFNLILVGDGEMRTEIESLVARYHLEDKVLITGFLSGDRVRQELLAARAFVLPSFAEGLPVVIMEAMALRRPIISTYVAGIPELVQPGKHGWLVPAGDVDALVCAMQACLDTPVGKLEVMGEAAHDRVMARHKIDTSAARLYDLFQRAISATITREKSSSGSNQFPHSN
ncbi:MAG TPA: glycosyltransferase family 4 protein [Candidatus Binataceae bacterium]|nr:glycosyltransferase family 4 protein [Candidatus Binataceae bacterium]